MLPRLVMLHLLLAFIPAAAAAQQADTPTSVLREGTRSIQLPFPTTSGTNSFGIWKMRSDRTALGLTAHLRLHRHADSVEAGTRDSRADIAINIGPALKRYFQLHPTVAGFGTLGAHATFLRSEIGDNLVQTTWGGAANAAIGAEWFPFSRLSLGGSTGISGGISRTERDGANEDTSSTLFLQTFTTAVGVQIYF